MTSQDSNMQVSDKAGKRERLCVVYRVNCDDTSRAIRDWI